LSALISPVMSAGASCTAPVLPATLITGPDWTIWIR
jgi:hypothetical protein